MGLMTGIGEFMAEGGAGLDALGYSDRRVGVESGGCELHFYAMLERAQVRMLRFARSSQDCVLFFEQLADDRQQQFCEGWPSLVNS
jgi:hypothetical protein